MSSKDHGTKAFINKVLKDYWEEGASFNPGADVVDAEGKVIDSLGNVSLKTLLVNKAKEYGITAEGAKAISGRFGYAPTWVDEYKDVWYKLDGNVGSPEDSMK